MSKRSLFYILSFAAGGFLFALWDLEFNFDPLPWGGLRHLFRELSFEVPAFFWFGGTGWSSLFWPLCAAGFYAGVGYVVGRAFRRLPSRRDDPRGHSLVKRFVLYFAALGYVLVLWGEGLHLAPLRSEAVGGVLWYACQTCIGGASGWGVPLILAPVNALIYAGLGLVIGRAFRRTRSATGA